MSLNPCSLVLQAFSANGGFVRWTNLHRNWINDVHAINPNIWHPVLWFQEMTTHFWLMEPAAAQNAYNAGGMALIWYVFIDEEWYVFLIIGFILLKFFIVFG